MPTRAKIMIAVPMALFLMAFGGSVHDRAVGRPVSFADISGMFVALFFFCLALAALYADLLARQRAVERMLRDAGNKLQDFSKIPADRIVVTPTQPRGETPDLNGTI